MRLVKDCYGIKYYLKKIFGIEIKDSFFEVLIVGYYRIFKRGQVGVNKRNKRNRKLIVSMTSIPDRINKTWITIESLLRQTYKPDRIILWLAKEEFKNCPLPSALKVQQKRGLQIKYCDNLMSYKKIYYTAKENPNSYIVTVDDDIIYAENMLDKLVKTYKENHGCIVCNRSHYIEGRGGRLSSYDKWLKYEERECIDGKPSFHNFFTGCGGTLFPVFLMDRKFLDKDAFLVLAPYADDVWLNFCAWLSNIKVVNTKGFLGHVIEIQSSSTKGLVRINVLYKKNDEQIEKVLRHFEIDILKYL